MGYYAHHAIVVIGFHPDRVNAAHTRAHDLEMRVTPIITCPFGFYSFMIGPDGSKEGWKDSEIGDKCRSTFLEHLDGTLRWCVVVLPEDAPAYVERCDESE